mgnify:CR=1 FL=1|tara:strand:- start:479 stop:1006 length:528 start_codon:yes stop_codon:yes gene_type:complete
MKLFKTYSDFECVLERIHQEVYPIGTEIKSIGIYSASIPFMKLLKAYSSFRLGKDVPTFEVSCEPNYHIKSPLDPVLLSELIEENFDKDLIFSEAFAGCIRVNLNDWIVPEKNADVTYRTFVGGIDISTTSKKSLMVMIHRFRVESDNTQEPKRLNLLKLAITTCLRELDEKGND